MMRARYVHTNLIARDWRRLATFYEDVLGCVRVLPERDLSGDWIGAATGIEGAHIVGAHLRLPGYGESGPTLEIFSYTPEAEGMTPAVNRPGLGHLAFAVDDVEAAREAVLAGGGGVVGEVVSVEVAGAGRVTFVYLTDPEGNVLEVQSWQKVDE